MTELQPSLSGYRGQDEASIPANGDENIYRYSESVEFDSFNLVHDAREAESPPPTPPVRDASSLKSVCYGPGHEKYPSWPSSKGSEEKNATCNVALGSHRSKSWTDYTNYPKEKLVQYTRPSTKRPTPTFTQQLKTVMEKCEKIPAESFESRKTFDNTQQQQREVRLWPRVDREGKSYGDAGYVVPSPPEREQHQPLQTLNHADFEAYIRNYPESQIDCYNGTTLTQEGLDEYTRVEHTQQPSYAQSEGYHSYVSSVDSTTNTPFLDRLRRDSEAVTHRPGLSTWEDISHEGRDSVVTTSSGGSASSSETLKWHGSMSDVSVSSGLQARRSEHWTRASISDVSSVDETIKKLNPNDCKCHTTINNRNGKSSKVIGNLGCLSGVISQSPFVNDVPQMPPMSKDSIEERYSNRNETTSLTRSTSTRHPSRSDHKEDWSVAEDTDSDQTIPLHGASKQLIAHSSRVQTPQRHHSESILYLDKKRNQRKFHPISSSPSSHNSQTRSSPVGNQHTHPSVSDRVDELEKQQIRYTYLDPDKRHRVSDPTLKAIQKKALLSFYERHHQSSWRSEPHLVPGNVPQKSPPQPPFRTKLSSPRRASSASDYANSNWRNNSNHQVKKSNPSDSLGPKHKHSNSCGSLSTALLGPVIVGTAISIDDWVPERPPKKPHLRSLYSERIPSPDLPPPSPPPVTDDEVFNCDEPLPPPPTELHDIPDLCKINTQYEDKFHVNGGSYVRKSKYERKVMNSNDKEFTRTSLRQSDQGLIENYPNYRITAGRSSLRYPSRGVGGMNDIKLATKMGDMSQQYVGNNHERVGPKGLLKSCSIRQLSKPTGRINHETSITLGQKPQPQVSRNHSLSINGQVGKPSYSTLSDTKNYKFSETSQKTEDNSKSADDRASQKYDDLSQYFPYHQQQNHYASSTVSSTSHAHSSSLSPPPLAPRQNMPGVKSMPPPRPAPPVQMFLRKSSKTSYAVNKHERHSPDINKSYKNTMVPPVPSTEWQTYQKCDNAVLRQITLHQQNTDNSDSSQYHHVQTLNQRIEERINAHHDEMLTGRLLNGSRKILQKSTNAISENNNNNTIINTDNCHDKCLSHLSHLSDERENSKRNYKTERSVLNGVEQFNSENSRVEQTENEPVMKKIETIEDNHSGQKLTIEMTSSCVEGGGYNNRHWTVGSVSDVHSLESIKNTYENMNTEPFSFPRESLEHSNLNDNNNEERSITTKRLSPQRSREIDYDESIDNERLSQGNDIIGIVLPENPQSEVSSLVQKQNSWTKSGVYQGEEISTNALKRIPSDSSSPLLSNNLKTSDNSSSSVSSQCSQVESQFSPCVSPQPGIEELKLLQRTEVVLRINTTLDAASQTESINIETGESIDGNCERVIPEMRKKLQEEIECEELSKNLAHQLGPHDKLVPILVPAADHKKSTDYVSGLFRVEATLHPRLKSSISYSPGIDSEPEEEHKNGRAGIDNTNISLSPTSEYFTISECKARFLARYSHQIVDGGSSDINGQSSSCSSIEDSDLRQKKEELVLRLDRKVVVLRAEQEAVREEDETNEALGAKVATRFSAVARPAEISKFRLHIEEVGKITSLLLGLSGRLARVENALHGMSTDHPEKKILESKRDKLLEQLEEAKILKINIDKRSANVSAILSKYLNDEEFADYQHFINMKTKLIMDSRELQDKVKLGEEQLSALKEAIG